MRITVSKAYDVAHCKTMDGSLVESILGTTKLKDTNAIARGRLLEGKVLKIVEKKIGEKIHRCGIMLVPQHPFIGASPDGICKDLLIEMPYFFKIFQKIPDIQERKKLHQNTRHKCNYKCFV